MIEAVRRLWLGVLLISLASAVLLISDWDSRVAGPEKAAVVPSAGQPDARSRYRIGVAFLAPDAGADAAMAGLFEGLEELGFTEGENLDVVRVQAQGEINLIPQVLQSLDASPVDAIVTLTTPVLAGALQTVRQKPVVFTHVIDPIAAGAGKTLEDHHPNVTGVGSFPPLEVTTDFFASLKPGLKRVGTLYNAGEANSTRVVAALGELLQSKGIELAAVTVASTAEVATAAQALAAKKPDILYVPGDNTVYQALASVADAGLKAGIPVVVDDPSEAGKPGVLAGVGVGHFYAGKATAPVLLDVLKGKKPAEIPLQNVSIERVRLNEETAKALQIEFPPAVLQLQAMTLDPPGFEQDVASQSAAAAAAPAVAPASRPAAPAKTWTIEMIQYLETVPSEEAAEGILAGLLSTGLAEGKDFTIRHRNAQGDIGALSSIIDNGLADRVDLFLTLSTPTLQAVVNKVKATPVVFTFVSNPFIAGAGTSDENHLPNFTGVYTEGPFPQLIEILQEYFPGVKRIGTLFTPAEVNSVHNRDMLVKAATAAGLEVETVAVNSPGELADAALALTQRKVQIITQVPDNQSASGFTSIVRAARHARIPIFTLLGTNAEEGAVVVLSRNYQQAGFEAGEMAARVIRGTPPAQIPFHIVKKIDLVVNLEEARRIGFSIPEGLIRKAERVIGQP